ncbi:MAG: class II aldolase/adducin family protein, partial [Anaerolineae bacterium]|nr:class II aldolase/adducin family protein [Anaerolineae bacterium]
MNKSITVVGGPFAQAVDPVLRLVPTGQGHLAAKIADEFEQRFSQMERIGNFPGGKPYSFEELQQAIETLDTDVVIFLPHLPNILISPSPTKLRLSDGETGEIKLQPAPKLVQQIKALHPEVLLVPFKLADPDASRVEVIRWMLDLHAGLAVYSRLGESDRYYIIDALANEVPVSKTELPAALVETVMHFLEAIRRRSEKIDTQIPPVPHLNKLVAFSRKMQPAFSQIIERNVASGRWPGNFSFRCTHDFLSSRGQNGFAITQRNIDKTGLTTNDFVWVSLELENDNLIFSGANDAKPSIDAPVHRVIYCQLPWVQSIVHGHLQISGENVHPQKLRRWPCGAENEGFDIVSAASRCPGAELWIANVEGHGFVALIGSQDLEAALNR